MLQDNHRRWKFYRHLFPFQHDGQPHQVHGTTNPFPAKLDKIHEKRKPSWKRGFQKQKVKGQ